MGIGLRMAQIAYDKGYRAGKRGLDAAAACTYRHTQARRDEGRWGWWHEGWHDARNGLAKGILYWDANATAGNALKVRRLNALSMSFLTPDRAASHYNASAPLPTEPPGTVAGNYVLAMRRMVDELNALPGVRASMRVEVAFPDVWPEAARATQAS